jgi:hypothetical protein
LKQARRKNNQTLVNFVQSMQTGSKPHYLKDQKIPWAKRNPRLYIGLFSTSCLLILFSRPIYDIFIREYPEVPQAKK